MAYPDRHCLEELNITATDKSDFLKHYKKLLFTLIISVLCIFYFCYSYNPFQFML